MKKTDIAILILVFGISLITAYFSIDYFYKKSKKTELKAKVIAPIKSNIDDPDPNIFTEKSFNPSVRVWIGKDSVNNNTQNDLKEK